MKVFNKYENQLDEDVVKSFIEHNKANPLEVLLEKSQLPTESEMKYKIESIVSVLFCQRAINLE